MSSNVSNYATAGEEAKAKLEGGRVQRSGLLSYPNNLDNTGNRHAIMFDINVPDGSQFLTGSNIDSEASPVVQGSGSSSLRGNSKISTRYRRTTQSIAMYMPDNISTVYSADWQAKELGIAAGMNKVLSDLGGLASKGGFNKLVSALGEGAAQAATGAIQQISPLQLQDLRNFSNAQIKNPYMEVMFNGIGNREFQFSFVCTPEFEEEAVEVDKIIRALRYHQAPEYKFAENNLESYLLYPSTFDITFLYEGTENKYLHKISTCALKNVSVDHNTPGGFRSFKNGMPVQTNITLDFVELEILTKRRIDQGF